jgi:hypothetical protein
MRLRICFAASMMMISMFFGANLCLGQAKKTLDTSKAAVILPFESAVKGAPTVPEQVRAAVILYLKDEGLFSAVLTPEEAMSRDKATLVEISGKLVEFKAGNMATRMIVGLGAGRASATFDFAIKDLSTGQNVWEKQVKKKASFFANAASSASQRQDLPEGLAKDLIKELKKAK